MTVIAMTREMGTLGKDVAAGLAEELDIEVVHHELVAQNVGQRTGVEESSVHRFLEGRASLLERWKIDSKRLSQFTADEILQLTLRGNVIFRGWGAAQLLSDIPHVLCVRVCAPMKIRIDEIVSRLNEAAWERSKPIEKSPSIVREGFCVGVDDARREIERNDQAHARVVRDQFGKDWQDNFHYDLVLNTGRMSIEGCINQLHHLVDSDEYQPTDASLALLRERIAQSSAEIHS
jgi:cytidylate kinase